MAWGLLGTEVQSSLGGCQLHGLLASLFILLGFVLNFTYVSSDVCSHSCSSKCCSESTDLPSGFPGFGGGEQLAILTPS